MESKEMKQIAGQGGVTGEQDNSPILIVHGISLVKLGLATAG